MSALARTNSPLRLASMPAGGMVENTRPPAAGSVDTAWHGIVTSRARGAPDTSGAVTSLTNPSEPMPCGQSDGGGGLLDRQQRHQRAQHDPGDPREDGYQAGDAVGGHEGRW